MKLNEIFDKLTIPPSLNTDSHNSDLVHYDWKTSAGNVVKLKMNFYDDYDACMIDFSVNGSALEYERERDPEILPSIFGVLQKAIKKIQN